jgi:hypothetical protein
MSYKAHLSSRRRSVSVVVDAEVDVSLADVTSEDLIDELEGREAMPDARKGMDAVPEGVLDDLLAMLRSGDIDEAILLLERTIEPKWKNEKAAENAYKMARQSS